MKPYLKLPAALLLIAAMIATAYLPAAAVTPTYDFGEEYKASPYYNALLAYEPAGDMRYDVLAVAFTQQGYHEGDSDAQMHGGNADGSRNFVEYNRMYGKLDNGEGNGMSYGYQWCAAFVSWCLRHSGVPEEIAVTEVSCNRMMQWHRENGTYHARKSGYIPLPGDIILFHEGSGVPHHVGLVVGTDGGRVYVIDGNGPEGMVTTHVYHKNSAKILGYCVPDYTVKDGTVYDFPLEPSVPDGLVPTVAVTMAVVILAVLALLGKVIVRLRKQKMAELLKAIEKD